MISRRAFLLGTACTALATPLRAQNQSVAKKVSHDRDILKGFIVSDAHFGWKSRIQPAPEEQREMIRRIHRRFPDLDVWIDTGDAHHSSLGQEQVYTATRDWTDIIANQSNGALFYYVPGNHEICGPTSGQDSERRCARMGSMSYRPYYSFDVKGIHFVSVPELEHPVYVNKETMDWLQLDLALNQDKTTILLSHNNIKGTTHFNDSFEAGYRGVANSKAVLDVMTRYPNVIGWMHGHNHDYVIYKGQGQLFVSNGRIGGFNPRHAFREGEPLGGIYFEITPTRFTARSYSAEHEQFLDEDMGREGRSQTLNTATTLKASAPVNYAFGHGGFLDGQRAAIYNYHTSKDTEYTLVLAGTVDACINENMDFSDYTHRKDPFGKQWDVFGYQVAKEGWPRYFEKENDVWRWLDPGVMLLARNQADQTTFLRVPAPHHGRTMYYRAVAGKAYRCELTLSAEEGGQEVELFVQAFSQEGNELWQDTLPKQRVSQGEHQYDYSIPVPQLNGAQTIYDDLMLDTEIQLALEARFTSLLTPLAIKRVTFKRADAGGTTESPALIVNGGTVEKQGALPGGKPAVNTFPKPQTARWTVEGRCGGSQRMLWYCRQANIDWQVRNAPVADRGSFLEIQKPTNVWSSEGEVVILPAPSNQDAVYVTRLRNMDSARIWPLNRGNAQVAVEMVSGTGTGYVEVCSPKPPAQVQGASSWSYDAGIIRIQLSEGNRATVLL